MTESILDVPAEVTGYLDHVRHLADANRGTLGFLPATAYREAAMKGRLWVAVGGTTTNARELRGYLFFGDRFPRLRVYQVYVCPRFRASGIARRLINKLKRYGERHEYLTITARVASELPANEFWNSLGFNVTGRCPGGKKGRTINRFGFALDVPSLFGRAQPRGLPTAETIERAVHIRPVLQTRSYVIDLNIFFDALRDRDEGEALYILSMGFDSDIRLAVTAEFTSELERHSPRSRNDPVLKLAHALPTLPAPPQRVLNPLVEELRRELIPIGPPKTGRRAVNDASDLVHLASCIHHRVYGFITRDGRILQRAEELHEKYNLRIISPADLFEPFEDRDARQERTTALVGEEEVQVAAFDELDRPAAEEFLRNVDVPMNDISACLSPGTTRFPTRISVVRTRRQIIGIGSWLPRPGTGSECVARLYVDEDCEHAARAVDHLLEHSINRGSHGQFCRLDLNTSPGQVKIRDVAIQRGFCPPDFGNRSTSEVLSKVSMKGVVAESNWRSFRRHFRTATGRDLPRDLPRYEAMVNSGVVLDAEKAAGPVTLSLFDFETIISPGALICPGRPGVMVPIRERYARQLLSLAEGQGSLLADHEAVLRLERAYFLAAGRHRLLGRGRLVVFYASRGRCEAVAMARVTFAGTMTKKEALLNLSRQGVLTEDEIQQTSNQRDEVAAFTFDNLIVFRKGITYRELRRLGCIGRANLVTIQKLPYDKLLLVMERAFDLEAE